jgi:hypothetical protein
MNKFFYNIGKNILEVFEKIAVIRTRQALSMLSDNELAEIGITRQQLANGNYFKVKEISTFISTRSVC